MNFQRLLLFYLFLSTAYSRPAHQKEMNLRVSHGGRRKYSCIILSPRLGYILLLYSFFFFLCNADEDTRLHFKTLTSGSWLFDRPCVFLFIYVLINDLAVRRTILSADIYTIFTQLLSQTLYTLCKLLSSN